MKLLILSDIHGNQSALQAVLSKAKGNYDEVLLLGDLIDYGPHSNEVIEMLQELSKTVPIRCNITGNHEQAVLTDGYERFSSHRGVLCAKHTKANLTESSWNYMTEEMLGDGICEFTLDGKKCLAVHGSLKDRYWKALSPTDDLAPYQSYEYVFSGHSHLPHFFETYYEAERPAYRNQKKTIFINPGSVGQPRNHNPMAQYAILDLQTEAAMMLKVTYDIKKEQEAFSETIDIFYKERLNTGI